MLLSYQDIKNIQKRGYDITFFAEEHQGWLQLKNNNGRCVFHNKTTCTIYEQRPKGCTLYPVVYDKETQCLILDAECPQRQYFRISDEKKKQLLLLVTTLEQERVQRKNKVKK